MSGTTSRVDGSCYLVANEMKEANYEPYLLYFIITVTVVKLITLFIDFR